MDYKIANRMSYILERDKISDPQRVCQVLKEEIKPILENYIFISKDFFVRFRKEGIKNVFFLEVEASRIKPFGYIPK